MTPADLQLQGLSFTATSIYSSSGMTEPSGPMVLSPLMVPPWILAQGLSARHARRHSLPGSQSVRIAYTATHLSREDPP